MNSLTEVRNGEGKKCLKEGEGISQGTCLKDPWSCAIVWILTMELQASMVEVGKGEIIWNNCKTLKNKNIEEKKE